MKSINPFNNQLIQAYQQHNLTDIHEIIQQAHAAWLHWKRTDPEHRSDLMKNAASLLRANKSAYAEMMSLEMGKIITEAQAEIEKCAWVCDYYAENALAFLQDEIITTDASKSLVSFQPLGLILAVMPWNFPFWQVFRFAAPAIMAGNAGVLKHASNVPGCALLIEKIFREAGFPEHLFRTLMIDSHKVGHVIGLDQVKAVTLTGSELAGASVAQRAGGRIKKTVLELGGSDPFVVLEDADIEKAAHTAVTARMINTGQSCIAAKRFIVPEKVLQDFVNHARGQLAKFTPGNPMDPNTNLGPLARPDLVDELTKQVDASVKMGATLELGGQQIKGAGCFFEPTLLTNITKDMPVFQQETFGPVMPVMAVKDEEEAIAIANRSEFGLGGSIWTSDLEKGERLARQIDAGAVFVNGLVKSDPRLPFGGIKKSGYGRELSKYGIREFVNVKTIWVG